MEQKNSPTRSVDRSMAILECFLEKDEMILLEIAERTGLSSSTALRILSALQERDFVVRNIENKTYRLGSKIQWLAEHAKQESYEGLIKKAYPYMEEMNHKYNEDLRLFVPMGDSKLCIKTVESRRELRQVIKEGTRHDLLRGAAGKIILSYMKENDRSRVMPDGMDSSFITEVRRKAYAISDGEREEGLFGIAVPILEDGSRLLAAVSMSGPSVRFKNRELNQKIDDMLALSHSVSEHMSIR